MPSLVRTAVVKAFAKINLGLRVLYRREDGFHELRTVFHTVSLADRLTISFRGSRTTEVIVEGMPGVSDNLAARAASAVLSELGVTGVVRIAIDKRIPMGAGLGGGSSDAAAVLLTLPVLARQEIPMDRLHGLAAPLGSDVPFFLMGGAALGLGRGEELYPLTSYPGLQGLLITPGIHVSTPDAYRALSPTLQDAETKLRHFQQSVAQPLAAPLVNDFESVVFEQHPELDEIKQGLLARGAVQALMSGSGSSLFGLFRSKVPAFPAGFHRGIPFTLLTRLRYESVWRQQLPADSPRHSSKGNTARRRTI